VGRLLVVRGDSILLVNATGGEPVMVAKGRLPIWSPDGSMFAFVPVRGAAESGPATLCIAQVDGSDTRCAIVGPTDGYLLQRPSWSPDGLSLAYSTNEWAIDQPRMGSSGLRVLDVATMSYRQVTDFPVLSPSWSPDGNRIALVFGSQPYQVDADYSGFLGTVAPDGTGFHAVSSGLMDGRYLFRHVAWSPSGEHLAFSLSDQSNCPMGCPISALGVAGFAMGPDGESISDPRILPADPGYFGPVSWSPDQTQLAFTQGGCVDYWEVSCSSRTVMVIGVGGDWKAPLVPDAHSPAWSR